MSEQEGGGIGRRRYLKYADGIAAVAVVAAAGYSIYESAKPSVTPGPTATPTLTPSPTPTPTITPTPTPTPTPYSRQETPDFWRGFWIAVGSPADPEEDRIRYLHMGLDRMIKRVNSPDVAIYNQFWTTTSESADVHEIEGAQPGAGGAGNCYPRRLLRQVFDIAHKKAIRVAYWPYLGPLSYESCPGWEGALSPTPAVFDAYRKLKAEEAKLAEEHQCEMFWLGGEWNEGYKHGRDFEKVLEAVRSNFSGAILVEFLFCDEYRANEVLTEIDPKHFQLMDYLGLSMLIFPMSKDYNGVEDRAPSPCNPSVPTMVKRLKRMADLARKASARFGKPIIFPELHAFSFDGAAYEDPNSHPDFMTRDVDYQEQADIIEATMKVLTQLEPCHGVSWNCRGMLDPGVDYPISEFELRGNVYNAKPAEKVLRFWYSKKNIRDGIGLLLTPDGHVDLENLKRENPLNEHGKTEEE